MAVNRSNRHCLKNRGHPRTWGYILRGLWEANAPTVPTKNQISWPKCPTIGKGGICTPPSAFIGMKLGVLALSTRLPSGKQLQWSFWRIEWKLHEVKYVERKSNPYRPIHQEAGFICVPWPLWYGYNENMALIGTIGHWLAQTRWVCNNLICICCKLFVLLFIQIKLPK